MNLDFSDEQEMLRDMVRSLFADHAGDVRAMEDDPVGYPPELWDRMRELDLVGLLLPEEHGGSGMSMLEGVVLYEEIGKALAPVPHFVSAVLSGGALVRAGGHDDLLARIASGDAVVTPAWLEPEGGFGPAGVRTTLTEDGDELVLDGRKRHVFFAAAAEQLLVVSQHDLVLVDRDAPGVTLTQKHSIASDCQYDVTLEGVRVPAANRVGDAGTGWATWHDTMLDGAILAGAQAMGGARHALDITVQYAKDREQFGKPLGAFQAIAHYLSDAVTRVDGGTTLVHEAAWARSDGRPVDQLAPMAKKFACRTFRDVTAMAQQVWGGVGFTLEYDIQLYFRRAKSLQLNWWDERHLDRLVAAAVLDGDTAAA